MARAKTAPGRASGMVLSGVSHAFLIGWATLSVIPLLWVLLTSLKTDLEIFADPLGLPTALHWENFARAWSQAEIGRYFMNTIIVMTGSVTITMLLGSMAAYVLARYEFRGNRIAYYTFAAGMMFPVFLAIVPLFFVVRNFGLLNTYRD